MEWAVMLIFFLLPTYQIRFHVLEIPATLLEGMILIISSVWVVQNYREVLNNFKQRLITHNSQLVTIHDYAFKWEIILLLIVSFAAVGVAGFSNAAFGIWKAYFFEPLLFYIILFNILYRSEKKFEIILYPLIMSSLFISLFAIYQKFTGQFIVNPFWAAETTRRVTGVFDYPNALSLFLGPIILLLIGFLLTQKGLKGIKGGKRGAFAALNIIAAIVAIIFAKSVGAVLGVAAGLLVFGFLHGKKTRMALIVILLIGIIGVFSISSTRSLAIKYGTLNDFSGQVRREQWREAWQMITSSPQRFIFGAGLSGYQAAVKPFHIDGFFYNRDNDPDFHRKLVLFNDEYKKKYWQPLEIYMYPHNIFLNFWSELGLAGMLLFIWIIIKFYILAFRYLFENCKLKIENCSSSANDNQLVIALLSAMTVIVVHGVVDVPYFKNDLSVIFWSIIAIISILSESLKEDLIKVKGEKA